MLRHGGRDLGGGQLRLEPPGGREGEGPGSPQAAPGPPSLLQAPQAGGALGRPGGGNGCQEVEGGLERGEVDVAISFQILRTLQKSRDMTSNMEKYFPHKRLDCFCKHKSPILYFKLLGDSL